MPISTIPPSGPRPLNDPDDLSQAVIENDAFDAQVAGINKVSSINELMSQSRGQITDLVNNSIAGSNGDFEKVKGEVEEGALSIGEQIAQNVGEPEVRKEYETQMRALVQTEMFKAKGLVQQQQLERMDASFKAEHAALVQQISQDPFSPIDTFAEEYGQKLAIASASGLYDKEKATALFKAFMSDAGRAKAQAMINLSPDTASILLNDHPEQFGLEGKELADMKDMAVDKQKDILAQQASQANTELAQQQSQKELTKTDLQDKITKGVAGAADIDATRNILDPETVNGLKKELTVQREATRKSERTTNQILRKTNSGDDLSSFTAKQIDRAYNQVLENAKQLLGPDQPLTLSVKASIARQFNAPITGLSNEISQSLNFDDPQQAIEALNAFRILDATNPQILDKLNNKDVALASYAQMLVDKAGVPDTVAIQRARALGNVDDSIKKDRRASFTRIKQFKQQNIRETTREALGADGWFGFGDKKLQKGLEEDFRDFAREIYAETPDTDAALDGATKLMKRFYGETSFNGGDYIMFAPPEKMFPGVKKAEIHKLFEKDILSKFPGIDVARVKIFGDDLTRMHRGIVSWAVTGVDDFGNEFNLVNPKTGGSLRWSVHKNDFLRSQYLGEARGIRKGAIEEQQSQDLPPGGLIPRGN